MKHLLTLLLILSALVSSHAQIGMGYSPRTIVIADTLNNRTGVAVRYNGVYNIVGIDIDPLMEQADPTGHFIIGYDPFTKKNYKINIDNISGGGSGAFTENVLNELDTIQIVEGFGVEVVENSINDFTISADTFQLVTQYHLDSTLNDFVLDGTETIVQGGVSITVTGTGSSTDPYIINTNPADGITDADSLVNVQLLANNDLELTLQLLKFPLLLDSKILLISQKYSTKDLVRNQVKCFKKAFKIPVNIRNV